MVPVSVKYILWYIFKSPQRKNGFFKSIIEEINGLLFLVFHMLFSGYKKNLKPVTICTGIKDRTSNYLDCVLKSILEMQNQELIELSIYDCGSKDADVLKRTIIDKWKGKLIFTSGAREFTRSYSFNSAIDQASNEMIFASDADMILPKNLVERCNRFVTEKTVWFPVYYSLFENRPHVVSKQNGKWISAGKGNFAAMKQQFEKAGKYNTFYTRWGWEDTELWINFHTFGIIPMRTKWHGFMHKWHPVLVVKPPVPDHLKKFNF